MKHLDIDTIIEYVMIDEINEETKKLASDVCSHIKECKECRNVLNAYLSVYGKLIEEAERKAVNRKLIKDAFDDFLDKRDFETHQTFEEYRELEI